MVPSGITLTKNTQRLLERLAPIDRDHTLAYLNNPLLTSRREGQPMRLWACSGRDHEWMETICDEQGNVDLKMWAIDSLGQAKEIGGNFHWCNTLPEKPNATHGLEFRRIQATIGMLAGVAAAANCRWMEASDESNKPQDMAIFKDTVALLAKHVPWVDLARTLAQRLHGAANAEEPLLKALNTLCLLDDLVKEHTLWPHATPCTTVQVLLQVHATAVARTSEHKMYALDAPNGATTYLFIASADGKPAPHDLDQYLSDCLIWIDAQGNPIFINDINNYDARFADMPHAPGILWLGEKTQKLGVGAVHTDWNAYHTQLFNAQTSQLCQQLASATPRELDPSQTQRVIEMWLNSTTATQQLWAQCHSKDALFGSGVHDDGEGVHTCLRSWSTWAVSQWATKYPTEHRMLEQLMEPMETLGAIETWRQQLRIVNAGIAQASCDDGLATAMAFSV